MLLNGIVDSNDAKRVMENDIVIHGMPRSALESALGQVARAACSDVAMLLPRSMRASWADRITSALPSTRREHAPSRGLSEGYDLAQELHGSGSGEAEWVRQSIESNMRQLLSLDGSSANTQEA